MRLNLDVTVTKEQLLEKIKENLTRHSAAYQAARHGFLLEVKEQLEKLQESIQLNPETFEIPANFRTLRAPESHIPEYQRAIKMLEMSVDDELELDQTQFSSLVEDDWEWKESWELSNSHYISKSRIE